MSKTIDSQRPRQTKQRYASPKSNLGKFLWRKKMWVESTFALTMLERWEKILVGQLLKITIAFSYAHMCLVALFVFVWFLFVAGATTYLPQHLKFLTRRARYYLLGNERESFHVDWPTKAEL